MMPKILEEFRELDKLQKTSEIISKFEDINKRETPISEEDFNKISYITAKAFFLQGNLEETLKIISPIISWGKKHDFDFYISLISLKAICFTSQGHFKLAQELYQDLFSKNEKVTESSSYPSLITNYAHCLLYQG
ncbi:MAG: hypothetical protein KAS95_08410, partial [Candidatus Heimdallarchaeota archaeon]|nr:hypothetical protein [Candidatus Heimdallarchaeota archaeon]